MNNCVECHKPTSHSISVPGGIRICPDCFFKDVPNTVSRQHPEFLQREEERRAAMEKKAQELIDKYRK